MLPAKDERQTVFSSALEVVPECASQEYSDFFGTRVTNFELLVPHEELTITARSVVETSGRDQQIPTLSAADIAVVLPGSLELTDCVSQTRRTEPTRDLARVASKLAETMKPHEAAIALCQIVHSAMTYKHGITGVHSIASQAWDEKVGVCQDFTHIVLGALRHIGIPARYVSGYLHPKQEAKVGETVVGESHAWVEWWAGSWFGFDPTNDISVSSRHIVVGRGRDYDDVPPLRGVFAGAGESELFVKVQITRES
jgi:transglutaminase-like putative cysteine protease